MEKITIKDSAYAKLCDNVSAMEYKAGQYCPTAEELKIIKTDFRKYFPFLVWIDETVEETEENRQDRTLIRNILQSFVTYVDDAPPEEKEEPDPFANL